jgi:hypothetical protein
LFSGRLSLTRSLCIGGVVVFSYKEHLPTDGSDLPPATFGSAVRTLLDLRDVAYTVYDHVQVRAGYGG